MSKALNSNVKRAGSPAESPGQKHYQIVNYESVTVAFITKTFVSNFALLVEPKVPHPIPGHPN